MPRELPFDVGLVIAPLILELAMIAASAITRSLVAPSTRPMLDAAPFARRAADCVRRGLCGLRGHLYVLHFAPGRLSLRCFACGSETHGWSL
jgi:hypothetical protein